jgi:hypothetical protein
MKQVCRSSSCHGPAIRADGTSIDKVNIGGKETETKKSLEQFAITVSSLPRRQTINAMHPQFIKSGLIRFEA